MAISTPAFVPLESSPVSKGEPFWRIIALSLSRITKAFSTSCDLSTF